LVSGVRLRYSSLIHGFAWIVLVVVLVLVIEKRKFVSNICCIVEHEHEHEDEPDDELNPLSATHNPKSKDLKPPTGNGNKLNLQYKR
jgi:hypothetical protein